MGCGLRKLRQAEDNSPGKIYSTLKRPQVETKIGVAYTYCHVDFLVGKEGTSIDPSSRVSLWTGTITRNKLVSKDLTAILLPFIKFQLGKNVQF